MRQMDCQEAGLETEWAVRKRLACTVQGRAVSSDMGRGGIDIEYVLEEQLIGLEETEEKKALRVTARMLVLATIYIIVLLTENRC